MGLITVLTKDGPKDFTSRSAAAAAFGFTEACIRSRIMKLGMTLEQALGIEPQPFKRTPSIPVEVDTPEGKRRFSSARAAAKAYGLLAETILWRLKSGWTTRQALELDPRPKRRSRLAKFSPEERKARKAAAYRAWAAKNREHVRQYSRKYYAQRSQDSVFRDYHNARTASWREKNPEKVRRIHFLHWRSRNEEQRTRRKHNKNRQYHADGEQSRQQQREWRAKNRKWAIERQKAYKARATPEQLARIKESQRRWRIENKEKRRESSKTPQAKETRRCYLRKKWRTDPQHKLGLVLRNRLNGALKGRVKKGSAVKFLGCTIEQLRKHLESLFIDGMTWDNWGHGPGAWQIDHVVPIALHDVTDPEQLAIVCHWSNLMPIWDEVHKRKTVVDTAKIREARRK